MDLTGGPSRQIPPTVLRAGNEEEEAMVVEEEIPQKNRNFNLTSHGIQAQHQHKEKETTHRSPRFQPSQTSLLPDFPSPHQDNFIFQKEIPSSLPKSPHFQHELLPDFPHPQKNRSQVSSPKKGTSPKSPRSPRDEMDISKTPGSKSPRQINSRKKQFSPRDVMEFAEDDLPPPYTPHLSVSSEAIEESKLDLSQFTDFYPASPRHPPPSYSSSQSLPNLPQKFLSPPQIEVKGPSSEEGDLPLPSPPSQSHALQPVIHHIPSSPSPKSPKSEEPKLPPFQPISHDPHPPRPHEPAPRTSPRDIPSSPNLPPILAQNPEPKQDAAPQSPPYVPQV